MGSETEEAELMSSTPRLQLFFNPHPLAYMHSPKRSGALTPPLYTSASVPFRWEEEPGKPRGCTANLALSNPIELRSKCLELPPRLLFLESNVSKLPSPTTVLDGPYMGKTRFQSSSFRIIRRECYGSFRRNWSPETERGQLSAMVVSRRGLKDRGFLGSWRWERRGFRGKKEDVGPSCVFPSSIDKEMQDSRQEAEEEEEEEDTSLKNVKITRIRRSGSFSNHTRSRFWATIYESLKQRLLKSLTAFIEEPVGCINLWPEPLELCGDVVR